MRSTVRIDDDLMTELKLRARRESVSLTRMLNIALRAGLREHGARPRYREQPAFLGVPRIDLDKATALAAGLEEEELLRKLAEHK